jgi:hypothetical protein
MCKFVLARLWLREAVGRRGARMPGETGAEAGQ